MTATDTSYTSYGPTHSTYIPKDIEWIVDLYEQRKLSFDPDLARMIEIDAIMNNKLWLPVPELASEEKPAVANLAQQGMSQLARRIASVSATHYFPSLNPGSKRADEDARNRGRVMTGWHHENNLRILSAKRARQFLAFATAPVVIKPDRMLGIPRWYVRNPLQTFPGLTSFEDPCPTDAIFVTTHTYLSLCRLYPEAARAINKPYSWDPNRPDYNLKFEILEYIDDNECVLVLVGHCDENNHPHDHRYDQILLSRIPNRTGRCLAIVPGSINLTDQLGHFDGIVGMYQAQAALMAISLVAQRRSVWPREWAEALPNQTVDIVTVPDPYQGTPGEINGGRIVTQKLDPSIQALELQDRLEYAQRMTAALPSEFGGMSPTNVRTGRRGAQVMGSTIDFTISEAQDVFAAALKAENCLAIAIDKAYFDQPKKYYIVTRSFSGTVDYTPSKLWVTDKHVVDYPIAGVDLQNLPIEGGQRVMMNTMSRRRFMEIDPVIPDADSEIQQMTVEALDTALLSGLQTQVADPNSPIQMIDVVNIKQAILSGKPVEEAVMEAQKEAQRRQAEEAPQPEPGQVTAPEAQPGLAPPGMGAEQPAPPTGGGEPGLADLTALLGQLGTVQQAQRYRR